MFSVNLLVSIDRYGILIVKSYDILSGEILTIGETISFYMQHN